MPDARGHVQCTPSRTMSVSHLFILEYLVELFFRQPNTAVETVVLRLRDVPGERLQREGRDEYTQQRQVQLGVLHTAETCPTGCDTSRRDRSNWV